MVAALAAVVALALSILTWRRQNAQEQKAYLVLALELERVSTHRLIAHTSLENRSPTVKHLDTVFLLVCPHNEEAIDACRTLTAERFGEVNEYNDLCGLALREPVIDDHRMLMPLDYYTQENVEVADEVLTYGAVIDVEKLSPGDAYSVRLILFGPDRLHRVVHRAFVR
ncbi:hypothetical protein AU197_14465 [Mycobacterium sp. IS-1590]|nr:hypothetical protein AU197_14465 [Mycobacterium sp. IS-1590]